MPRRARPAVGVSTLCLLLTAGASATVGCAKETIPNTDVEDTPANREVIQFVERYRRAVQRRDVAELLQLASPHYLDDNGTPQGDDDVDYEGLKAKLARWKERVRQVRYEIRYRRVRFHGDRIWVDYTYTASFQVRGPDGELRWERRLADNRLELVREGSELRILSGM